MYDPTMRVMTVLEMLQTLECVTGAQLAERLEVHPRTVQRYITRLQDLGVPVKAARGVGGGYFLKPGFRLPPMMFTGEEALAVLLGLRALRDLGLSAFAPASEGARAKLSRVLPLAVAEKANQIQDILDLDVPWLVEARAPLVLELAAAVQSGQVVRLSYAGKSAERTQREAEPYGVLRDAGRWYLVGFCRLRSALRCFRIDRIEAVTRLEESFSPPAAFDSRAVLHEALAAEPSLIDVSVWLDLPPNEVRQGLPLLRPILSERGGGTLLRCGVESLIAFAAMLLALNVQVVVERPSALPSAFEEVARRASALASADSVIPHARR